MMLLDGPSTQVHKGVAFDGTRSTAGHMLSGALSKGSTRVQGSMRRCMGVEGAYLMASNLCHHMTFLAREDGYQHTDADYLGYIEPCAFTLTSRKAIVRAEAIQNLRHRWSHSRRRETETDPSYACGAHRKSI